MTKREKGGRGYNSNAIELSRLFFLLFYAGGFFVQYLLQGLHYVLEGKNEQRSIACYFLICFYSFFPPCLCLFLFCPFPMTHLLLHNRSHGPQLSRVSFCFCAFHALLPLFYSIQARIIIQSNRWRVQTIIRINSVLPSRSPSRSSFIRADGPLCAWSDDHSLFPPAWLAPCRKDTSHPSTTCNIIVLLHPYVYMVGLSWLALISLPL